MGNNPITLFLGSMGLTRDGWTLWLSKWASVVLGLAAMGDQISRFGIPASWEPKIALAAFIIGIISANHQETKLQSTDEKVFGAPVGSMAGRSTALLLAFFLGTAALTGSTTGCASAGLSAKQKITVDVLQPTHDALANAQDFEIATFNAGTLPVLTPELHAKIERALGKAFTDHAIATRAVRAWRAGDPVPNSVMLLKQDVDDVLTLVKSNILSSNRLVTLIQGGVDAVASALLQFGVK